MSRTILFTICICPILAYCEMKIGFHFMRDVRTADATNALAINFLLVSTLMHWLLLAPITFLSERSWHRESPQHNYEDEIVFVTDLPQWFVNKQERKLRFSSEISPGTGRRTISDRDKIS